jgi:uncharacterized metal-binding protein YceD (DUF177 family)
VKKNFDFIKIYKIFQTTKDANNYNNKYFDEYEVIAIQENPSILTLVEDEILFEFSKIVNHEGCNLPESFFSKEISAFELDSKKNEKNNPFAKLKEKLHK